jgi:ornithine--oxo-acid transaminase
MTAKTGAVVSEGCETSSYQEYVNPQWVALPNLLDMSVQYQRCCGCELFTTDGRRILDFLSGFCVQNAGHNHPHIVNALKQELGKSGPAMLHSHVPAMAGQLAEWLCTLADGGLGKAFFGSSGSEGVEAAIKFARATAGKPTMVYVNRSFHGLTAGSLSLMSSGERDSDHCCRMRWDCHLVTLRLWRRRWPAGDARHSSLNRCRRKRGFASRREPICRRRKNCVMRAGRCSYSTRCKPVCTAREHFWRRTSLTCSRTWWCWAKALSGGLLPVSAVLMKDKVYRAVYSSLKRAICDSRGGGTGGYLGGFLDGSTESGQTRDQYLTHK